MRNKEIHSYVFVFLEFIFLISSQLLALSSHSFIGIALIKKRAYPYIAKRRDALGFTT